MTYQVQKEDQERKDHRFFKDIMNVSKNDDMELELQHATSVPVPDDGIVKEQTESNT